MARRDLSINMEGLEKWQQALLRWESQEVEITKDRILRSAGLRLLEHLDDLTPVRAGLLRQSMSMGDRNNVFQIKVGTSSYMFVGTAVKYAKYVNDGFTQKAGQFVPGFWSSGAFHYDPNAEGGIVLTGKVIPGAHMFEKAMDELHSKDLKKIADYEFRRLHGLLFNGGR